MAVVNFWDGMSKEELDLFDEVVVNSREVDRFKSSESTLDLNTYLIINEAKQGTLKWTTEKVYSVV